MNMKQQRFSSGQSLVEVLLAVAIFALLMGAVIASFNDIFVSEYLTGHRTEALRMAEEGLEASRAIRDRDFQELVAGSYGVVLSGNQWAFFGANDTRGIFTRTVEISEPDAETRYVTSTVSWSDGGVARSVSLRSTITDWQAGGGGGGPVSYDWTNPSVAVTYNLAGNADALSAAASGTIGYIGRASSGDPEFVIIDASSSTNPTILGSLQLNGDVYGIAITHNYAYLATTANNQELVVVNISNPASPGIATSFNLAGNGDGRRVAIKGTRLYLTRFDQGNNPQFHVFDITNPASPTSLGSADFGANLYEVALSQVGTDFAFIATANNSQELIAVNVTNPVSMGVGDSLNLGGNSDAYAVAVSGTIAYLGTQNRGGTDEFYVVNISTPTSLTTINSADYDQINVLRATNGYLFAGLTDATEEFIVFNLADPNVIIEAATINLANPVLDLGMSTNRAFAVTGGDTGELVIIVPAEI